VAITAVHGLFYTPNADELRAFFRDVLGWRYIEDHPGWLIFALPPAELGVHPSEGSTKHELCFMCDDIASTLAELTSHGVEAKGEPEDMGFGVGTTVVLPGGVEVLLYESRHQTPLEL
jgi:catechol 2,3-dioxygenase-like lactoylglutathione lyase family enzyme